MVVTLFPIVTLVSEPIPENQSLLMIGLLTVIFLSE